MKQLDYKTIARPYAKAAFQYAVDQNNLEEWSLVLENAAQIASHPSVQALMRQPNITQEMVLSFFYSILNDQPDQHAKNFLQLLALHKRLMVLPEIFSFFSESRAEKENIICAEVISALPLTQEQEARLSAALRKKLKSHIKLNTKIDPSILGGAIVRAKDLVIDGSGRTKLTRLIDYIKGNVV